MKTIIVSSTNPVKIEATRLGFERMFPEEQFTVQGISVPSGVSHQPVGDAETLAGAMNRASAARVQTPQADYWVGIEGGVEKEDTALQAYARIVVLGKDKTGVSRTGYFPLPPRISELVEQGIELGVADDMVFARSNSKQGNGAIGILTNDVIDRTGFYEHAVILALVPFRNPDLY